MWHRWKAWWVQYCDIGAVRVKPHIIITVKSVLVAWSGWCCNDCLSGCCCNNCLTRMMLQQLFEVEDVATTVWNGWCCTTVWRGRGCSNCVKWMVLQQLFKVDDVAQLFSVCSCSNCLKWALRKCVWSGWHCSNCLRWMVLAGRGEVLDAARGGRGAGGCPGAAVWGGGPEGRATVQPTRHTTRECLTDWTQNKALCWASQWSWFAWVRCNLLRKKSWEVAASLPARFLSRRCFTNCKAVQMPPLLQLQILPGKGHGGWGGKRGSLRCFLADQKIANSWKKCVWGHRLARTSSYCLLPDTFWLRASENVIKFGSVKFANSLSPSSIVKKVRTGRKSSQGQESDAGQKSMELTTPPEPPNTWCQPLLISTLCVSFC